MASVNPSEADRMGSGFLWGVAISGYQAEGGYNRPGEPQANWALAEAREQVEPLGESANFWRHYQEDLVACRAMGLTAFRLSIEWSRVQPALEPSVGPAPPFDKEAIAQYAKIIAACLDNGLEPIVTLHHFVHPAWLGQDPWLSPAITESYLAYVREVVIDINNRLVATGRRPVRYFTTINEPNMLVMNTYLGTQFPSAAKRSVRSALVANNHLLMAHLQAYNLLHDLYVAACWGPVWVSLNNYASDIYWLDKVFIDLLHLREQGIDRAEIIGWLRHRARAFYRALASNRWVRLAPLNGVLGNALQRFAGLLAYSALDATVLRPLLDTLYRSPRGRVLDYLALDYYDPFCGHTLKIPAWSEVDLKRRSLRDALIDNLISKWWDWRVLPEGLRFFCEHYAETYARKPLLIAENGMAQQRAANNRIAHRRDGIRRSTFLELHASEVIAMVRCGIPLLGYLHWSLFDNYEWGTYSPRFGLFSLDYARGTQRQLHDHYGDCPSATYARIIREAGFDAAP